MKQIGYCYQLHLYRYQYWLLRCPTYFGYWPNIGKNKDMCIGRNANITVLRNNGYEKIPLWESEEFLNYNSVN